LEGGTEGLLGRLKDPHQRLTIQEQTLEHLPHRWCDVLISAVATMENQCHLGKTIEEIAAARGETPIDTIVNLLIEEGGAVNMISFNQSEDNLKQTLAHPLASIISDGFYVKGRPHPRLFGTFPRLLGTIARDRKWMPLEQAIHKITGKPAQRFGFKERGLLHPGFHADVVVFDPAIVDSPATFSHPELPPVGIDMVIRGGKIAWSSGDLNFQ
jgi:dihydroorotase/N-acyl-D-amino-acid deacylase